MYQSLFEFLTRNPDATLQDLVDAFPDADLAFAIQKLHEYGYIRQPTFEDARAWATAVTERGAAKAIEAITQDYRKSPEYREVQRQEKSATLQALLDLLQANIDLLTAKIALATEEQPWLDLLTSLKSEQQGRKDLIQLQLNKLLE